MFDYTRAAFNRLVNGFKVLARIVRYGSLTITLGYFGLAIAFEWGHLWANIATLALTLFSFIFEQATNRDKKEKRVARKVVKRVVSWGKIAVKTVTLGMSIYGIYLNSSSTSALSIILATLMIIMWILQVLFQLIANVVEDEFALIYAGIKKDFEPISQIPKKVGGVIGSIPQKVGSFFDKLKGKEVEEVEVEEESEPDSPEIEKLKKQMEKERRKKERTKKAE